MPPDDLPEKGARFSRHEGCIFPLRMVRQSRSSRVALLRLLLPGLLFLQPSSGETPARFVHPGVLHGSTELEFVRGQIASGEEPWVSAWEALVSHRWASLEHHGVNFHGRRCYREYQKSGTPNEKGRTEKRKKCARRGWRKRYRESTKKAITKKLKKGNTLPPIMFSVPYPSGSRIETWVVVRFQGIHTTIRVVHRLSETP